MSNSTPTTTGQTASKTAANGEQDRNGSDRNNIVSAINQMFAEFQLVYNNQYHKAFPTTDKLEYAKRLWFPYLKDYSAEQIISACHRTIKNSEFLPTVKGLLKYMDSDLSEHGLPESRQAYIEACKAPSPKINFKWSHPAVYLAGQQSDWFFLAGSSEYIAFPVFEKNYRVLCEQVLKGKKMTLPKHQALPEDIARPMNKAERKTALEKLRKETGV